MWLSQLATQMQAPWQGADMELVRVSTDTRTLQPGDFFVALRGEHFDGHSYLSQALAAGAGGADGRIYKALADLNLIAAHDTKVNYKPSETLDKQIVVNGGNYFKAAVDRAKEEFNAAGAGLTSGQIGGMGLNQRALDTVAGKTFAAKGACGVHIFQFQYIFH